MNDLISRQAAIDALADMHCKSDEDGYVWIIRSDAWARIDALPSAQPERKVEKTLAEEVERIKREITDIFDEQMGVQPEEHTKERTETHACDKEKLLSILESAKDKNGEIPMSLVRKAFEQLPSAQTEIILCKDCKYWRRQTNYAGAPLSFGFCESDDMWKSLYGETIEVEHIDTDDNHYCSYAERREE